MESSLTRNQEAHQLSISDRKHGGWITVPFILATMGGLSTAAGGWISNLIVYLIQEFNVKDIDAAQIFSVFNGCITVIPILGAIIADSFMGCFSVIWISSIISLLGMVFLLLTSMIHSLRPPHCETGSTFCPTATRTQLIILYGSFVLISIGVGGTRFTIGTMGADQLDKPKHQGIFFNWFVITMYLAMVLSSTAIVYVQDNVSWAWGFGLSVGANVLGFAIFVLGSGFYRHVKPKGSPFVTMARVLVAALRKRKTIISTKDEDYCQELHDGGAKMVASTPSTFLKYLNRAALKTEGDMRSDGSIAKPWQLCSVQQVEDLKRVIRMLPLWSTGAFLSTPIAILMSLSTVQALAMDRHVGPHFTIPAGSMGIFIMISTCIALVFMDFLLFPAWSKFRHWPLTPLRRVAIGHVLCALSMVVSAIVEWQRLKIGKSHHVLDRNMAIVPMSVFWLVPQLAIVGIGEAFHFPGNIALYYQEFPTSLKSTSTAMVSLSIGFAFYLSTAVVDLLRRTTGWLPNDINHGRVDNVYWVAAVIGLVNFGYFLVCAWLYKYQNAEKVVVDNSNSIPEN